MGVVGPEDAVSPSGLDWSAHTDLAGTWNLSPFLSHTGPSQLQCVAHRAPFSDLGSGRPPRPSPWLFLRPPPLPPLAAAVTGRSSRTAVLVRPPLPTARGGNRGESQRPTWLQSRHSVKAAAHPRLPGGGRTLIGRELHPVLTAHHLSWTPGMDGRQMPHLLSLGQASRDG